jgi:cell wall-associated NlpC family hydrolase
MDGDLMNKPDKVKDAAIQRIGCPYVYGGTGKTCTPQYREARMAQYPQYASKIRANCPRLRGSASSCAACKWCDPETGRGKLCYDCAQFALACMRAVDIPLVSGSDSQWRKTLYSERGVIADMPRDKVCLVFRNDSDSGLKFGHVGVYIGDGTVVHASGHESGVIQQKLEDVKKPFTHYLIPSGLYDDGLPTLRRGNSGSYVVQMQTALNEAGCSCDIDGKFGSNTETAVKIFQNMQGLKADGICGAKTWDKLKKWLPEEDEPDEPEEPEEPENPDWTEDEPVDDPESYVKVDREAIVDMINQIEAMRDQLDGMAYVARGWI